MAGIDYNGHEEIFVGMDMLVITMVIISQVYTNVQSYKIVHFNYVQLMPFLTQFVCFQMLLSQAAKVTVFNSIPTRLLY